MVDRLSHNTRLLLACAISAVVFLLWDNFILKPNRMAQEQELAQNTVKVAPKTQDEAYQFLPREQVLHNSHHRVSFENSFIKGTINLQGARIDDLLLKKYNTDVNSTENVILFSPSHTHESYFAEFGWLKVGDLDMELPNNKTIWTANKASFKGHDSAELHWTNKQGITFVLEYSLDEKYMFTVKQKVINHSRNNFIVNPYALASRFHDDIASSNIVVHQGPIGVFDEKLKEISYEDLAKEERQQFKGKISWFGFSDKYWLSAFIPSGINIDHVQFSHKDLHGHHHFQTSFVGSPIVLKSNDSHTSEIKFFAGAKELDILDDYGAKYNVKLFDRAVDFGVLYFITRPILILLHYFHGFLGNFGVAILLLTVFIKLLLFPLAHKGYKGMNRLKDLQPKMSALKEKHADNPSAFQQALIELYRKEKVNPMAGCLPILLQIPVFFALYKVLYVSIEMRHAPFFWWIKDLSAPDPTNIFTLLGLLPFSPPSFLMVGVLPLIMALTMYWQQKLNPEPTDPTQAMVMKLMPWVLLFMFASFPSGLVIYWAWSNILSIAQQLLIRKLEGGHKEVRIRNNHKKKK
jgi:YidC/Oxa1 family membrane protein insertase